jgi:uncharacterized NAD(P)/FAD-binding protein YdhS
MTTHIAIVGGGISGTLTVLNCIKLSKEPLKIIWFDAKKQFCKGLAYTTENESFLLNVRAYNMSVFSDDPNHFIDWLKLHYPHYSSTDFISRKIFGEYVTNTFVNSKLSNPLVSINQIGKEVIDIQKIDTGFEIISISSQTYKVKKVVLALGNFLPAHPQSVSKDFIKSENYFQNAFHPTLTKYLECKKNITIIGSGLTMIDIVISLQHSSNKAKINIISPHAYIPLAHNNSTLPNVKPFIEDRKIYRLTELLSIVNAQLKKAKKEPINTHSIIDVMRPHLQFIWLNFTLFEKQQFIRHLRHRWGVARHRAPAQTIAVFNEMKSNGSINLLKGRIYEILKAENAFEIFYLDSKSMKQSFKTDCIINCTGPESNYLKVASNLVQNLIKNNLLEQDPINCGIKADKNGEIAPNIYTLGPPLKGVLWESTAVPEIRIQAKKLANKIIFN